MAEGIPWQDFKKANSDLSKEAFCERFPNPFLIAMQQETGHLEEEIEPTLRMREDTVVGGSQRTISDGAGEAGFQITRRVYYLPFDKAPEGRIRIGRLSDNEVTIDLPRISKRHASLAKAPGSEEFLIQDENSANGTFIKSRKLAPNEQCSIQFGDGIGFSQEVLANFFSSVQVAQLLNLT